MILTKDRRYNFIGIGGIGMSGIARILNNRGFNIAGSDKDTTTNIVKDMIAEGITVYSSHNSENVQDKDILVISDAIKKDNPELIRATELGLLVYKRADLLTALVNNNKGITISGTHGKTTTSGMISQIVITAKLDPTCILGGEMRTIGGNARNGKSDIVIAEACEAYNSFIELESYIGVVNNIEVDHLDFHKTAENLYNSFAKFIRQSVISVINGDDENAKRLISYANKPITFGVNADNDYIISINADKTFSLKDTKNDIVYDNLSVNMPGKYNIYNATAATITCLNLGISIEDIRKGLLEFPGMGRRFELLGKYNETDVIDDYAHHPTEILSVLSGAKERYKGNIIAVFQPHLFSRTRDFLTEFAESLKSADILYLAPIYPARELPIEGIDHKKIREVMGPRGEKVICLESLTDGASQISKLNMTSDDLIITIGAGDVNKIGYSLVNDTK